MEFSKLYLILANRLLAKFQLAFLNLYTLMQVLVFQKHSINIQELNRNMIMNNNLCICKFIIYLPLDAFCWL